MTEISLPRDLHGRAAARPLAVPRLLPEAGARPRAAERRARSCTTSRTTATTRSPRQRGRSETTMSRRTRVRSQPTNGERPRDPSSVAQAAPTDKIATPSIDWLAIAPPLALFARRDRHRARTRAAPTRSCGRRSLAARRVRRRPHVGRVHVRAVAHRRRRRAVPGDRRAWSRVDGFAVFVQTVVLHRDAARALARRPATSKREQLEGPEYYALMLCSATGMMLMASANDLIIVFLSLEILSIALYVLAAFDRRRARRRRKRASSTSCSARSRRRCSSTASRSSTARRARRTSPKIAEFLATTTLLDDGVLLLGHRAAARRSRLQGRGRAVPHVDARRVPGRADAGDRVHGRRDEGRRVRGASCGCLLGSFELYRVDWRPAIWGLAVLSLLVGSIAALVQTDVKRMLAYSSIRHAGYILIGVQAATAEGNERRAVLSARVRVDGVRRVRGRHGRRPHAATTTTHSRRLPRARVARAGARRVADVVPARAGRRAAHRRLRREALGVRRGRRRGPVLARPHRHARPR